jgi:hypothetical protein
MLYFVQLWKNDRVVHPLCERIQAPSEGHAVVQVMPSPSFVCCSRLDRAQCEGATDCETDAAGRERQGACLEGGGRADQAASPANVLAPGFQM